MEAPAACPACGEPFAPGDAFCEACGAELPVTEVPSLEAPAPAGVACPSCGTVGEPVDAYCGSCGIRLPAPRDHTEVELAGVAGVSDKGKRHNRNEDAMAAFSGRGFVAAVVCDGVSSSVDPDVASEAAAGAALAVLAEERDLEAAFDAARAAVLAIEFERRGNLSPPSCTFLAATVTDQTVTVASHGDCRAYWYAGGDLTQLTVDDSMAEVQIAAGMPAADAHTNAFAHVITRWLSADAEPEWRPRIVSLEVPEPGRLLLVSDGLWNYAIEPDDLAAVLAEGPSSISPEPVLDLARRLVAFANDAGGSDNITVVVVDLPLSDLDLKGSPAP
ncbi:MAG: PP2C family serine/threonine-protein phosphatase [Acidimicrobiales bacterium]